MPLKDLQKVLKDKQKKAVFGSKQALKLAKLEKIKEVYLANNCSPVLKDKLSDYAKLSSMKIDLLSQTVEELTLICEKSFPVSVVGILS